MLIALVPAVLGSDFLFGLGVLPYYLVAVVSALAADWVVKLVKTKRISRFDLSPVVTGVLLAMSLPLGVPLWFAMLGPVIGIVVAKELFGGIGFNFLNPALFGRLVLRLLFAEEMLQNPLPRVPFGMASDIDVMAQATPLAIVKEGGALTSGELWDSFLGLTGGKMGETSALLLLMGAVWLFAFRIIRPRIPVAFLASIAAMAFVFGGPQGLFSGTWQTVAGHLLGGATVLGAFFMITDYSSSPSAPAAQILFGVLCGVVTMLFRLYSPWSEGFTFAILIVNLCVPLMNAFVRPRVLGEKRMRANT